MDYPRRQTLETLAQEFSLVREMVGCRPVFWANPDLTAFQ